MKDFTVIYHDDPIVTRVITKYSKRSSEGMEKYGVALDRTDVDVLQWLDHLQEELMDATLYLERMRDDIEPYFNGRSLDNKASERRAYWRNRGGSVPEDRREDPQRGFRTDSLSGVPGVIEEVEQEFARNPDDPYQFRKS